jgi:hypothetical protein
MLALTVMFLAVLVLPVVYSGSSQPPPPPGSSPLAKNKTAASKPKRSAP